MELEQKQAMEQTTTRRKLDADRAAYIRRHIVTPAMQDINARLSQLYNDIMDAADLPEYNRRELDRLLNMQGATYPLSEQIKNALIY